MKILTIRIIALVALITFSCDIRVEPEDLADIDGFLAEEGGIETATNGNYALFKEVLPYDGSQFGNDNNDYTRHFYQMSEFPSDNVMYTQFSSDPLYLLFTREHAPRQENSGYFWFVAYRMMLGANLIINAAEPFQSAETDQLIGENYFLRALTTFDLLRFYAKSYNKGRDNLGVILRTEPGEEGIKARSTVGECYDQVIADLEMAELLMSDDLTRGVEYGSKIAAQALLSRVYLYMGEYSNALTYADLAINNTAGFRLSTNSEYLDNFANTQNSFESIFTIKFTIDDHRGKNGSIGSMYYDDGNNNGWGEVFASASFRDLVDDYPEDIRNQLIVSPGGTKSGYPIHYITKFSGQDGIVNLVSPQYLRLSEVYLNRAEANANLNNDSDALDDVNIIRTRAGLSGTGLYTAGNLGSKSVLDVVLEERRLELAYEGHRAFDLVRNARDLVRNYEGIHQENGDTRVSIPADDNRWVFFIPSTELLTNPDCEQNQ